MERFLSKWNARILFPAYPEPGANAKNGYYGRSAPTAVMENVDWVTPLMARS